MKRTILFANLGKVVKTDASRSLKALVELLAEHGLDKVVKFDEPLLDELKPKIDKFNKGEYKAKRKSSQPEPQRSSTKLSSQDLEKIERQAAKEAKAARIADEDEFAKDFLASITARVPAEHTDKIPAFTEAFRIHWRTIWRLQCTINAEAVNVARMLVNNPDPSCLKIIVSETDSVMFAHNYRGLKANGIDIMKAQGLLLGYTAGKTLAEMLEKFLIANAHSGNTYYRVYGDPRRITHPVFRRWTIEKEDAITAVTIPHRVMDLPIAGPQLTAKELEKMLTLVTPTGSVSPKPPLALDSPPASISYLRRASSDAAESPKLPEMIGSAPAETTLPKPTPMKLS